MAILILIALFIAPVLAYAGIIGWLVAALADIAILFVAAWGIDRGRKPGARNPFLDQNRSDFPTSGGDQVHRAPAEAFQSPSDRGVPD
jgi:hypothetical protein